MPAPSRLVPAGILLVSLAAGCRTAPPPPNTSPGTIGPGPSQRYQDRRMAEALAGLTFRGDTVEVDALPQRDPALAARRLEEAAALTDTGYHVEAVKAYAEAVRADPGLAAAYDGLGKALQVKGRGPAALASFRTALRLAPDSTGARFNLAMTLWMRGERAEAIAEMERLVARAPDHGEAHAQLSRWHYYGGDMVAARRHAESAAALGQTLPPQFERLLGRGAAPGSN